MDFLFLMDANYLNHYQFQYNNWIKNKDQLIDLEQRNLMNKSQNKPMNNDKLYTVDENGVAHAQIKGVLSNSRSIFDMIFGTAPTLTYSEIVQMADQVDADPNVKELVIHADTPGGRSMGADDASVAISLINKPVTTKIEGMLASAGYYVVAGSNKIVATSEQNLVGSIGTVISMQNDPNEITIASSDAPNKRPDPTTPEGKAVIQEFLDQIQSLFVRRVAEGRNVSIQKVQSDFGKGGTLMASQALAAGMIDSIETLADRKSQISKPTSNPLNSAKTENSNQRGTKMDIEKLKSEHPAVFAEAVQLGVTKEKERVTSLKSFADADQANVEVQKIVNEAIINGSSFEAVQAKLLVAMRDFKTSVANNAPPVPTSGSDPASGASGDPNQADQNEIDAAFQAAFKKKAVSNV